MSEYCNDRIVVVLRMATLIAVFSLVLPLGAFGAALEGLSIDDVAALRGVGEIAISPRGDRIAYILSVPRRPGIDEDGPVWAELHVVGRDGTSRGYVTGKVRIERISWAGDGSSISYLGRRGEDKERRLFEIPVDGGESRQVVEHGDGLLEYAWSSDRSRLVWLSKPKVSDSEESLEQKGFKQKVFEEQWRPVEVWVAAVDNGSVGEPTKVELAGSASEISLSPDGDRLIVALAPTSLVDDGYMKRRLHVLEVASAEIVATVETSGKLGRVAWSPDGEHIALIAGADAHDPAAARLMVVKSSGGAPQQLQTGAGADAIDAGWLDADTLLWIRAAGVQRKVEKIGLGGDSEVIFGGDGPIWTKLSIAPQTGSLALVGDSPSHPSEVFVGAVSGGPVRRATVSNPWLGERRLGNQEVVDFAARDGLALQGLLIRPFELVDDARVPLVLIAHGGPEAHFANGWLTTYSRPGQVLAARGYAVFYPNYRGSTGRGLEFAKMSQGDPAGKEFDDLIDAVDHLIDGGLVDRDRVGITGGSYGGYATAWGATYFSERFAAGVMAVGISEKVAKLGTSDIPNELYLVHARMWPWENWQKMLERSPVYYVEKARTPLLIMGGDEDPRVHPSQSLALFRYLKILGQAPVRYVVYPGEKHGNAKAAARYDFSLRLLRWFDHYLMGPGGEPPPHQLDYGFAGGGEPGQGD